MNQCSKSLGRIGGSICSKELEEGLVIVWEAFVNCKIRDLHQMKDKLNQISYHSILQYHAIPSEMQLVGQGFVLMQDNDPKCISKLCQRYIKSKEEQHVLPAYSADLNSIELMWDELGQKIRAKQPISVAHLW